MGFFTEEEVGSLRLARMSLHIVGGDEEFAPQQEMSIEHDDFLLSILREISSDSVYRFEDVSTTRTTIESIAKRELGFQEGAQKLAADFRRFHDSGGIRDGAFFVFELGSNNNSVRIYALVKYDYNQALELVQKDGATGLRRIFEAFVSDKKAIQKSALVRTIDGAAEPGVSTRDRTGKPSPTLTDFFRSFLQVTRERSDHDLTKEAKEIVRQVLTDNKELLPKGGLALGVSRANGVLRSAPQIDEQILRQAVWVGAGQPTDDETRSRLDSSVDRQVRRKKLTGVAFATDTTVLPQAVKRTINTHEGVRIEYNTALEGAAVVEKALPDGRVQFVVTTESYTDDVNPERSRRTP